MHSNHFIKLLSMIVDPKLTPYVLQNREITPGFLYKITCIFAKQQINAI